MASVTLRGVVKRFGALTVIPTIDLEIRDRELIVFVGPSGCGKSTLLRIIAGLEPLDAGEVFIGERCVNEVPPAERDIAMVFQDYALYPHMSVYGNMAFGLEMRDMPKDEIDTRVKRAADLLHIGELLKRKPKELSGGQRQRVAMGRAMVRNPQVFLFDEPLSNLDAKLRAEVRTEIKALAQALQTTMVYVTHDQVEAMTMADRIVVLKSGIVQQVGTPHEVYQVPANQFVAGFIGSPTMNFFKVTRTSTGLRFSDGTEVELDARRRAQLDSHAAAPLVLGVRSEHLQLAAGDGPALQVKVSVVEPLGSDTFVYFDFDGARHVARLTPDQTPRTGDVIRLAVNMAAAHLFDAASGEALRGHAS